MPGEDIRFRTLHTSALVQIREYQCPICAGGPGPEEASTGNSLVLLRRGSFCRHFGRRSVMTDVNQAALFTRDSCYRVSHPGAGCDRGTVFTLPQRIVDEFIREWDPAGDDQAECRFPFPDCPCEPGAFWRYRQLVRGLEARSGEPLRVELAALQLIAEVLAAGFARHGLPRAARKEDTLRDHRERVEAGKRLLADHLGDPLSLDQLARALHTSPFHFARVFQHQTGTPLHRYLTRLRLRASLERLFEGHGDLAGLALELGFSSHSHFTGAFRREFGLTPSQARQGASVRRLEEMRKKLEAPPRRAGDPWVEAPSP